MTSSQPTKPKRLPVNATLLHVPTHILPFLEQLKSYCKNDPDSKLTVISKPIGFPTGQSRQDWVNGWTDKESTSGFSQMGVTGDVLSSWASSSYNVILSLHTTWAETWVGKGNAWKDDEIWHAWCSVVIQCRNPNARAGYGKMVLIWDPDGFEKDDRGRAKQLLGAQKKFYKDLRGKSRN